MIGAVVVLYNPTKEEIQNINTYKDIVAHTVVFDNSSGDNRKYVEEIIGANENITYMTEHSNLGLAKGFNVGINFLKGKGCDWVLLFDADSKMDPNLITAYERAIKNNSSNVAVFSPVHVFERSNNHPYAGYKNKDWTMTSGCLYNIVIFCKQKGFNEALFVDGLDMDYCFRSIENGYKVIECGEAIIIHNPADTRKILGFRYGIASPFRYYMQARQLIWNWKRYNKHKMAFVYLYKWFKVIFLFPDKLDYIKSMLRGTKEGFVLVKDWKNNL